MRQRFEGEPALNVIPIEKIVFAAPRSRDELAPILAGLQWIWCHPTLRRKFWGCWSAKSWPAQTDRAPRDGFVANSGAGGGRPGLDANFDRLED